MNPFVRRAAFALSFSVVAAPALAGMTGASYAIPVDTVSAGVGEMSSAGYRVRSTVGGFAIGSGNSTGYVLQSGFQSQLAKVSVATVSVTRDGTGGGTVTSNPAGIVCGETCAADFALGGSVTLTAAASVGSTFTGWTGCDTANGNECTVSVNGARAVTATFTLQLLTLTVAKDGTGTGTVTSTPAAIDCGGTCASAFGYGTVVSLAAAGTGGSTFTGWSGACTGTGACEVTMTEARSVTATFSFDASADTDGDGIPNGVELAEGRNPGVKDNDIFSPGASAARLFAMQMYRDFLSREGDPAGIQGWADLITAGTYTRNQVIDAFLQSQEFSGFVAPVVRLYFATFLRVPDYDGLVFNAGLIRNGTLTPVQLADFFANSPEFLSTYGALDNSQFVTLLYNNVLGRAPDQAGLDGWVALLNGGMSRGQVLYGFAESPEYQAAMANEVFVTMMYAGMLRRTPEPAGFSGWVQFLDAGTYTREQVINGFFLSTEYYGRFLP
jgi:hypothetical protein